MIAMIASAPGDSTVMMLPFSGSSVGGFWVGKFSSGSHPTEKAPGHLPSSYSWFHRSKFQEEMLLYLLATPAQGDQINKDNIIWIQAWNCIDFSSLTVPTQILDFVFVKWIQFLLCCFTIIADSQLSITLTVSNRTILILTLTPAHCVEISRTNDYSRVVIRDTLPGTSQSWINQQRLIFSTLQLTSLNTIISFWSGTVTVESLETMMTQKSQWQWLLLHDIHQPPRFDRHSHTLLWCWVL